MILFPPFWPVKLQKQERAMTPTSVLSSEQEPTPATSKPIKTLPKIRNSTLREVKSLTLKAEPLTKYRGQTSILPLTTPPKTRGGIHLRKCFRGDILADCAQRP